jgi:hypothetical protein
MSVWLDSSSNSNKFKQSYFRDFVDVSGDILVRNGLSLKLYNNNIPTRVQFSVNSKEFHIYNETDQTYYDISNTKLIHLQDLSENIQSKLNQVNTLQTALNSKANASVVDTSFALVNNEIATKAPLANPTFNGRVDICGNIFAATATAGSNTTQLATTAFVTTAVSTKADLVNPTFTGNVSISDSNGMTVLLKSVSTGVSSTIVSPIQLGQDIDGEAAGDQSGTAVSMNSDGTIVAISGVNNDGNGSNAGHVRVYKYDVNKLTNVTDQASPDFGPVGWRRLGQDIDGEAAADGVVPVSLSDDGLTVAVGASNNDGTTGTSTDNRGNVRIYKYQTITDATWTNYNATNFTYDGATNNKPIVVAGGDATPVANKYYWVQMGVDIDGEASGDSSGRLISLNADGTTVAIGAHFNDGTPVAADRGHVRIYKYQTIADTTWTNYNATNSTYDGATNNKPIVVAGGDATPVANKFYWVQMGVDIDGEAAGDLSGLNGVSINSDGTIVAIGSSLNDGTTGTSTDNRGHVRIYKYQTIADTTWTNYNATNFTYDGATNNKPIVVAGGDATPVANKYYWVQMGVDIEGEAAGDQFGRTSISSDGTIVAVGAIWNDGTTGTAADNRGNVRIYKYQTIADTTWTNYNATNFTYDGATNNKPIVVAGGDATPVANKYYWVQMGIDIDGEASDDWYSYSVSLSADGLTVAIGGYRNDGTTGTSTDNRGHVRIYKYDGISWNQILVDIDGEAAGDESGVHLSLSKDGTTVAIGARSNDGTTGTSTDNRGHVRVYQIQSLSVTSNKLQISNQVDICGNFYAQYPAASIPANAIIGGTGSSINLNADISVNSITVGRGGGNDLYSTAIGYQALTSSISGDAYNTAVGYRALASNTNGNFNTAVGVNALQSNQGGAFNVAIGTSSLNANQSGNNNIALNWGALLANIIGNDNIAVGKEALKVNQTGNNNIAIGTLALHNSTSSNSSAIGWSALQSSSGTANTAFGYLAGGSNTTGEYNTFIGYGSDTSGTSFSNSSAIGANAKITASNQIALGTSTETVYIPGKLSVVGELSLISNLLVSKDVSFNSKLFVGGNATMNSKLTVAGDASFSGRVDICGNFYAQYPPNSIPASAIIGGVGGGGGAVSPISSFGTNITFDNNFALIKEAVVDPMSMLLRQFQF